MLAEQVRSGVTETIHHGAVAVVDLDGDLVAQAGEIDQPFYFRSAAKPFQAAVSQALGAGLAPTELALACASHDGEAAHLEVVEGMLAGAGLSEADLRCPPDWPLRPAAMRRVVAGGAAGPRRIFHNCSGKHAAMLRACQGSGWPLPTYPQPDHPLQVAVLEFMVEVAGVDRKVGVDGCGVPVFLTTTRGMASAFARLAHDQSLASIYTVMHTYPGLVSGEANPDAAIARHCPAVAKRGAMGSLGVAVAGSLGVSVKCWDGSERVAGMAAIATLDALGITPQETAAALEPFRHPVVRGGGETVGAFRSRLELRWS